MINGSNTRRHGATLLLAFVLSCAVLLQVTLGAFAAGAMGSGPQRDIFGNLLCLSEGGQHNRSADHGSVPACCAAGCLTAAIASAPPPQNTWTLPVRIASELEPVFAATTVLIAKDTRAHQPRGPPIPA